MHIFLFNLKKKTIENPKLNFLTIMCEIRKNVRIQSCSFQEDLQKKVLNLLRLTDDFGLNLAILCMSA